jgi:hypothetical protein
MNCLWSASSENYAAKSVTSTTNLVSEDVIVLSSFLSGQLPEAFSEQDSQRGLSAW